MNQLKSHHLFVISTYFNAIEDYINLELATPKAKGMQALETAFQLCYFFFY